MEQFEKRAVSYLGLHEFGDWKFKMYSLKRDVTRITPDIEKIIKSKLPEWIEDKTTINSFPNYKIGTVIIHEATDSILTVVNWWIYENVIQNHVYLCEYDSTNNFEDYSNKGLRFCVWEMNILWHERNLWVDFILKKSKNPDWESYLTNHYALDFAE